MNLSLLNKIAALMLSLTGLVATVYGQEPLPTPAAVNQEESVSAVQISQELEQRRMRLQAIQEELGAYDLGLVEAYNDLARFYIENENPQEAAELYQEALMIIRVNAGLHSEQQLPVLDSLIASNTAAGLWQEVDDSHHLKYSIQRRLYTPSDPAFLGAVNEFGDWKLRLVRENLLDQNYRTLSREAEDLSDFYSSVLASVDNAGLSNQPGLTPLLYGKSVTDMELARYLAETPYQYFAGTVSQYINQTICNNVRAPDGSIQRSCYTVQRENPRYRQSQQDAKRLAVMRSMREVGITIDRLQAIFDGNPDLPGEERTQLQSRIGELRVEYERIDRVSRRGMLL